MEIIKVVTVNSTRTLLASHYGCIILTLHLIPSGLTGIAMADRF